jgi:hypothetical protein
MKGITRLIGIFIAAALGAAILTVPVEATTASHAKHRQLAYKSTLRVFHARDQRSQEALCYGWAHGIQGEEEVLAVNSAFTKDLNGAQAGRGMSRTDRRYGIVTGLNEACSSYFPLVGPALTKDAVAAIHDETWGIRGFHAATPGGAGRT